MNMTETWITFAALLGNYYLTTFSIWFGHWFAHLKSGPLTEFHSGHHLLYPNSQKIQTRRFQYAYGRRDSNFALVPWLLAQEAVEYFLLTMPIFVLCLIETIAISLIVGYIHMNFHLLDSRLQRLSWFCKARDRHALHHDLDANYMVADHLWDKMMGTYVEPQAVKGSPLTLCRQDPEIYGLGEEKASLSLKAPREGLTPYRRASRS